PPFDDAEHHRLYMVLLRAATSARLSEQDFAAQQAIAATVSSDDMSFRATLARGATISHRGWGIANEMRTRLRHAWHDFFRQYDVLLAPVAATAAFPHDHNPDRDARRLTINGKPLPYSNFLFWAGPASLSYLPAT